jgi:TPR repeat protein
MYVNGEGVAKNYENALKWYKLAAEKGVAVAQYNMGVFYSRGEVVSQDRKAAARWFRKAANQGDTEAQAHLGSQYLNGTGLPKNDDEAAKWLTKAAEKGHAGAQTELGRLHIGRQEFQLAANWTRRAAKQGQAKAQYALGLLYLTGRGVARDHVESYKWFNLASAQGDTNAVTQRNTISDRMTREQIAEAQMRSAEFVTIQEKLLVK